MKRWAIPDDWNPEQDGYISVLFCIPNSRKWRGLIVGMIDSLAFGWSWNERTGSIKAVQEIGREIFESMAMGCIEELVKTNKALIAALTGDAVDLTQPLPDQVDYTETGLVPTLVSMLEVDRTIYSDMNVAEVLFEALIGRKYEGLPLPFEGVGLADIADEQLYTLHRRFRQTDLQIPGTEKNITETLETLLRTTGISDPEWKPNIADVMDHSLNVGSDSYLYDALKNIANQILTQLGINIRIPVDDEEPKTIAEILLLISRLLQQMDGGLGDLDMQTNIQVNNYCGCGDTSCNGACQTLPTITIEENGNGSTPLLEEG